MSACAFGDGWHLLIHFPRQLFVKLCLAFTARMCHEWFCWSAVDSWANPGMLRLTGSACLNVESSGEDQAPNQPSDLHCVASAATKHLYPSLDTALPVNRPVDTIEIRGGPSIAGCCHLLARHHMRRANSSCGKYHACFKQSWNKTSEVDATTPSTMWHLPPILCCSLKTHFKKSLPSCFKHKTPSQCDQTLIRILLIFVKLAIRNEQLKIKIKLQSFNKLSFSTVEYDVSPHVIVQY